MIIYCNLLDDWSNPNAFLGENSKFIRDVPNMRMESHPSVLSGRWDSYVQRIYNEDKIGNIVFIYNKYNKTIYVNTKYYSDWRLKYPDPNISITKFPISPTNLKNLDNV